MPTHATPTQLSDLAGVLRRRWPVVAATAITGLVLGTGSSFLVPVSYTATTTLSVNPMNADPLSSAAESLRSVSMPTEAQIARSRTVAELAHDKLTSSRRPDVETILDSVTVDSPDDSLVLSISFAAGTARAAAAGADAVAEAYLETRRDDAAKLVDRLVQAADKQIDAIDDESDGSDSLRERSLAIQADSLGTKLAQLGNLDLNPGAVVGRAEVPSSPTTPGILPLGVGGLFLGLIAGVPLALMRKEDDTEIGGVEGLGSFGDQIVLDGTKDTDPADTWDIAALMLKLPADLGRQKPFMIMVDGGSAHAQKAGRDLVDALGRHGRPARHIDASTVDDGKISRGWPTEKMQHSWAGRVVVIDTTRLSSAANKVALATRSDAVVLARSITDDASTLRRLVGLLTSKRVDIALTALFPAGSENTVASH